MNKENEDLSELLKKPLPSEAISKHPTKPYLSSIKAIYVTERFTEVFGVGGWTTKVSCEHVNHETGMVVIKVTFEVPSKGIYYESYGGNDNGGITNKNFDLGDAYKGATTDALTKIGSYLGVGIDVFKGIKSPPQTKQEPNKKELPILTSEKIENAVKFLIDGKTMKELKTHYSISAIIEKQIEAKVMEGLQND